MTSFIEQGVDELLKEIGTRVVRDDSRKIAQGDVLVVDSRVGGDVSAYAADALARGASLVISDVAVEGGIRCAEPGKLLAAWARRTWPAQPKVVMGVTGTSGKTSVAWFGRQIAALTGKKAASVGTLGVMRSDTDADEEYTGFTSPTALKMHPILDGLAKEGITHATVEVSSHALDLNRADGVRFAAGGLINITQDHLDYHKTWEAYAAAKLRLFSEVLPVGATAVFNIGRSETWPATSIAKQRGLRVLSVGTSNAELVVEVKEAHARGLDIVLKYDAVPVPLNVPLVGSFQAENLAVALGLLLGGGLGWKEIAAVAGQATSVPGRMEIVQTGEGLPSVVVDYAHKPDALQRALESLRPLVKGNGRLVVVFGCGGNRDALKRPIMGRIAAALADVVYVTDDNPRKEDAGDIRRQVMAGVTEGGKKARNVGNRRKAIEEALSSAGPQDVILIAGKGHEQGQILRDETLPFDDRVVVREILQR